MMPWLDSSLLRELAQDHDSGVILALEMGEWEQMAGESWLLRIRGEIGCLWLPAAFGLTRNEMAE